MLGLHVARRKPVIELPVFGQSGLNLRPPFGKGGGNRVLGDGRRGCCHEANAGQGLQNRTLHYVDPPQSGLERLITTSRRHRDPHDHLCCRARLYRHAHFCRAHRPEPRVLGLAGRDHC